MRLPLFILVLFITPMCLGQSNGEITWGSRDLTWKDFQGKVDPESPYKAISYTQIHQWYTFNKDTLKFDVSAQFITNRSWVLKKTDRLLKHEQIHFDITEYVTRLFRKELMSLSFNSYDEIKPKIAGLFKEFGQKRKALQKEYDNDTDHSKIVPRQEKWNEKVFNWLEDEEDYSVAKFSLYIGYLKELDHNKPK